MWLLATSERRLGASAYQFAAFRIATGVAVLLCLGAGLGLESSHWLELPRTLRAALRLLALVVGLGIATNVLRRAAAALAAALTVLAGALGFCTLDVTAQLLLCELLAASIVLRQEPLTLIRSATADGNAEHPHPHWSTAAWGAFGVSAIVTAASSPPSFGLLPIVGTACALAWVAVRGPGRGAVTVMLGCHVLAAFLSANPALHLFLSCCGVLAVIDEQWLPALGAQGEPVLFYDGECGLCQSSVQLILREDRRAHLKLGQLQGQTATEAVRAAGVKIDLAAPESMLVRNGTTLLQQSDAVLFIAGQLGGAWRLCTPFRWLPRAWRDAAYRAVALRRYAWFGRVDSCLVPDAKTRERFLP